jgi:hypothetical protein
MATSMGVRWNAAVLETNEWIKELKLQRAIGSHLHKALGAIDSGDALHHPETDTATAMDYYRGLLDKEDQVFVVEHDWAAAFEEAEESGGMPAQWDFRTPYPNCCFEFQLNGKRLCFVTRLAESDGTPSYHAGAVLETSQGWMAIKLKVPLFAPLSGLAFKQVRAICIALDAEVAETEIIRAAHKLNRARMRRKVPLVADYHTVKLARRSRPIPLPGGGADESAGIRLHFRRGHWRHFEAHKTWINWTLVGNPDLGFIDKHYRL